ncbi:MAG: hypothetical protein J6A88_08320 [Oscillospiraceae bacterium]|nr:hypothetical protein [Oscillospiraceae bacterium]
MIQLKLSKQGMREGVALNLPATPAEVSEACAWFDRLGIPQNEVKIVGASSPVRTLDKYIVSHGDLHRTGDLDKLNILAEQLEQMDKRQQDILGGAVDSECISSLDDVLEILSHLDRYVILPNIVTNEELGRFLVDTGYKDFPEETHPYLNYAAIGMEYYTNNGGAYGPGGYVRRKADPELEVQVQKPLITIHLYSAKLSQARAEPYRLALPALDEEMDQAAQALGVDKLSDASIVKMEIGDETLKDLIPMECVSVTEANHLAMTIEELRQWDELYQKYLAVLSVEQPETMTKALYLSVELDDYEFMPEDDYEYGQAVLRRHGATDELLDRLLGYLNMEGLGRDARADDGVRKTEYGDLRRCSEPFPDITQQIELGGM